MINVWMPSVFYDKTLDAAEMLYAFRLESVELRTKNLPLICVSITNVLKFVNQVQSVLPKPQILTNMKFAGYIKYSEIESYLNGMMNYVAKMMSYISSPPKFNPDNPYVPFEQGQKLMLVTNILSYLKGINEVSKFQYVKDLQDHLFLGYVELEKKYPSIVLLTERPSVPGTFNSSDPSVKSLVDFFREISII